MKTTIRIERWASTPMGTFGNLWLPGLNFRCYTVEKPWAGNMPEVSCIPPDPSDESCDYLWEFGRYHRGDYPCIEIPAVPDRTYIKIHAANIADELLGCIAPGEALGAIRGRWAVTNSRRTLKAMYALLLNATLDDDEQWLSISWRGN